MIVPHHASRTWQIAPVALLWMSSAWSSAAAQEACWMCRGAKDEIVIGVGSMAIGLSTTVAAARLRGGLQNVHEGIAVFVASWAGAAVAGSRAHTDRARYEDVLVFGAAGAPLGMGLGFLIGKWLDPDNAGGTAGAVIGFGFGLLAGAVLGNLNHTPDPLGVPGAPAHLIPAVTLRW